jgi:hypothetical protein
MKVVPVTVLFSALGPRLSTLITAETAMEKGAEWLSIVPSAQVACDRGHEEHEKVYTTEWSGYFRGVKGTVVFFDASDGEKQRRGKAASTPTLSLSVKTDIPKRLWPVKRTPRLVNWRNSAPGKALDFGGYDDENSEFMFQNSLGKVF